MTKIHEDYIRTNTSDLNESDILDKGELTVVYLILIQNQKHQKK